jgi:DNA repair protein RadC
MPHLRDLKTEMFKVICLHSNNRIIEITDAMSGKVQKGVLTDMDGHDFTDLQ